MRKMERPFYPCMNAGLKSRYLLGQALGVLLLSPYSDISPQRSSTASSASQWLQLQILQASSLGVSSLVSSPLPWPSLLVIVLKTSSALKVACWPSLPGHWLRIWVLLLGLYMRAMLLSRSTGTSYLSFSHSGNVSNVRHRCWTFYLATIIVTVTGMLMYFIRESCTSQLLEHRAAAMQFHRADLILRTAPSAPRPSIFQPVILFFIKSIIFLSSLTSAFSITFLYLFAVAFPLIYAHYAWNRQRTTLIFLSIALGLFFSALTRFHDRHATRKYRLTNRRPSHSSRSNCLGTSVTTLPAASSPPSPQHSAFSLSSSSSSAQN